MGGPIVGSVYPKAHAIFRELPAVIGKVKRLLKHRDALFHPVLVCFNRAKGRDTQAGAAPRFFDLPQVFLHFAASLVPMAPVIRPQWSPPVPHLALVAVLIGVEIHDDATVVSPGTGKVHHPVNGGVADRLARSVFLSSIAGIQHQPCRPALWMLDPPATQSETVQAIIGKTLVAFWRTEHNVGHQSASIPPATSRSPCSTFTLSRTNKPATKKKSSERIATRKLFVNCSARPNMMGQIQLVPLSVIS